MRRLQKPSQSDFLAFPLQFIVGMKAVKNIVIQIFRTGLLASVALTPMISKAQSAAPSSKVQALAQLLSIKAQNNQRIKDVDAALSQHAAVSTGKNETIRLELNRLALLKKEFKLRQSFLDRLIFQIDTRFKNGTLANFVSQGVHKMSEVESRIASAGPMAKFLNSLNTAISKSGNLRNVIDFVEGYIEQSTIAQPKSAAEVLKNQNYSNGVVSVSGSPVSREDAGDLVESRLKAVSR